MFKTLFVMLVLVAGCARTQTMPMPNAPTYVTPEFTPESLPVPFVPSSPAVPVVHTDLPADKQAFKGDLWELRADKSWRKLESEDDELVIVNADRTVKASLYKQDYVGDLKSLTALVKMKLEDMGYSVLTSRTAFINTRSSIALEGLSESSVVWAWSFVTGAEGYVFVCGGGILKFDPNQDTCIELLKGLYIGRAP